MIDDWNNTERYYITYLSLLCRFHLGIGGGEIFILTTGTGQSEWATSVLSSFFLSLGVEDRDDNVREDDKLEQ